MDGRRPIICIIDTSMTPLQLSTKKTNVMSFSPIQTLSIHRFVLLLKRNAIGLCLFLVLGKFAANKFAVEKLASGNFAAVKFCTPSIYPPPCTLPSTVHCLIHLHTGPSPVCVHCLLPIRRNFLRRKFLRRVFLWQICLRRIFRTRPFLNILVEKNDHEFVTSLYRKPTFTG